MREFEQRAKSGATKRRWEETSGALKEQTKTDNKIYKAARAAVHSKARGASASRAAAVTQKANEERAASLADIRQLCCNGGHPEELRRACLDVIKRLAGVTTAPTAWAALKHSNDVLGFCEETQMLPSMLDHAVKADSGKVPLAQFPWTGLRKVTKSSNRCTQTPPLCLSSVCVTRVSWK